MSEKDPQEGASPTAPGATSADFIVPVGGSRAHVIYQHDDKADPLAPGNRLTWQSWWLVIRRTWNDFFLNKFLDRGAVLAFFMLLSFAPTVLSAYSIAILVLARNEDTVNSLADQLINDYVPNEIAEPVRRAFESIIGSASQGTVALIIGVAFALFSSSAYVRAFARSSNSVYGRVEGRASIRQWLTMWGLTFGLVIGAVLMLGAFLLREDIVKFFLEPIAEPLGLTGTLEFLVGIFLPVWQWLRYPVIAIIAVLLVAMLYYFAPNVRPSRFRWLTFGSVIALVCIALVRWLFDLYLSYFAGASAYGAIGTLVAALIAVWVMNIVLIVGVKIDAEVLRAKELQVGYDSEKTIQSPPRSSTASVQYAKTQQKLESAAKTIKEKHANKRSEEERVGKEQVEEGK
ncbi:YihY/virulence factor BrkB family protein [Corynebacterium lubricantis]|uniref:YihY/virulence factor BrkB family protein n=1 Tax=Corynebacterium lubricantis TaxID=541095 RepID=UPI0012EA987B|nr:YihY/virulence factor BrkB family protein [Corynebacterium lubricantis]